MSDILGEARVRIRPDTSTFAAELKAGVAGSVAASEAALASARKGARQAKEAGTTVRNLATATQALTTAQNANRRVVDAAAKAFITGAAGADKLAVAQERAKRAAQLVTIADKAVERSKLAVAAATKAEAGAIAAGVDEVTASVVQSRKAAETALFLAEANKAAAISHETKAKAALSDARAEEAAAAAAATGIKGTVGAAAAAAAARSRGVLPGVGATADETTKAGANAAKAARSTRELGLAQNALAAASNKATFATREITNVTGELAIAQIRASRAAASVLAAEEAVKRADAAVIASRKARTAAVAEGVRATILQTEADLNSALAAQKSARDLLATAVAHDKKAAAALRDAKAEQVHASQLSFVRRGVLATGLSFLGLRGATLAANSAFIAAVAATIAFSKSLGFFAGFESQLKVLQVTTGATADEMERVSEVAKQLGADVTLPGVSARDAADAMLELAKAGLSVEDSIAGARGVLQLATAAAISNADAVQLAASALNAFGLAGDQAQRVADVLANAANSAQGSITDMGLALQQAAAVGRQVGLGLEDTTVFITALTRAGIRGSDAGTSLRTALLRLVNPTKKIKAVFDELGLSLRDTEGNLRPDFFVNLGVALEGLSKKQRDAKIAILGGADAIRSLSILSRQSIEELIGLRNEIRQQGTASEVAAARTSGLTGAGKALQNTFENIGLSLGQSVAPGIESFLASLNTAVAAISSSNQVAETLNDTLDIIGFGFESLGTALTVVGPPALGVAGALQQIVSSIGLAEILAAVAAYKLLGAALKADVFLAVAVAALRAKEAIQGFAAASAIGAAITGTSQLKVAATGAAGGLATLAAGLPLVAIGAAAAAAALVFLFTRESQVEQATKSLKKATDEAAASMAALTTATEGLDNALANVKTNKIAVETARLAVAQSKGALANSQAARGSFERRQLENQLAIALDTLANAEGRLLDSQNAAIDARDAQVQASKNRDDALRAEESAIKKIIASIIAEQRVRSRGRGDIVSADINNQIALAESVEAVTVKLRERAQAERKENTAESRDMARRLELLATLATALDTIPTEKQINVILTADSALEAARQLRERFRAAGDEAGVRTVDALILGMGILPTKLKNYIDGPVRQAMINSFVAAGEEAGDKGGKSAANAFANAITAAKQDIQSAATRLDIAVGSGAGLSSQLAIAQDELAAANRRFEAARKRLGLLEGKTGGATARAEFQEAADARRQAFEQVKSIEEQIANESKKAADDAKKAREESDQNFIEAVGAGADRRRTLIERAGLTESFRDDIKFNEALRRFLRKAVEDAKKTIKDAKTRAQFIRDTTAQIRSVKSEIRKLQQQQRDLIRQRREDRRQEIGARLEADIEFAQIRENTRAEIRAREARIRFLQAQQRALVKEKGQRARNTAEYKRLRNEIASEQKAIAELRKEQKGLNDEARKLIFEFLQTQQSFAAQLLGNLFPSDLNFSLGAGTPPGGGLSGAAEKLRESLGIGAPGTRGAFPEGQPRVGGLGGVADVLRPEAAVAEARDRGPTQGQANTEIALLREIRDILLGRHRGGPRNHPEAQYQRAAAGGAMDLM